jgi:exodeoxyribonuclease VII large subunit
MWGSNFRKVKFKPENGLAVIASGFIDVYTVGGKYQFYVDSMQPAGLGALQLAFQQMAERLKKEGLFDEARKKKIPAWPERIGILTSESGAALHDIAESIYSRWPAVKLFLYPVAVQGEGAAEEIAAAIREVNRRNNKLKLDVLIVGRGGGSLEDLWAFNEEVLARAIYNSQIPIISAVGHEVDVTIADLVADARASTPTKAGIIAVPDGREVLSQLTSAIKGLQHNIQSRLRLARQELETVLANALFRDPRGPVLNATQQVDEAESSLRNSLKTKFIEMREKLSAFYEQMIKIEPSRLLGEKTVALNNLQNRTRTAAENIINKLNLQLTAQENRLAGLNPRTVLVRGYSITTNRRTGKIIKEAVDVAVGDIILTELAGENLIESEVKTKHNKKDID